MKKKDAGNSPAEYFTDTAMTDPELPGNVARPDAGVGELHNLGTDDVRQWPTVDKHTP